MAAGRPTTYTDEVIELAYDYINNCPDAVHSVVGLAIHIGRAKSTVYKWAEEGETDDLKAEFSDIVKCVNELAERKLINGSLTNELNAQVAKMMLSKYGHVEVKSVDNVSSDGSMSPAGNKFDKDRYKSAQSELEGKLK